LIYSYRKKYIETLQINQTPYELEQEQKLRCEVKSVCGEIPPDVWERGYNMTEEEIYECAFGDLDLVDEDEDEIV
jgi:hypothetical protein